MRARLYIYVGLDFRVCVGLRCVCVCVRARARVRASRERGCVSVSMCHVCVLFVRVSSQRCLPVGGAGNLRGTPGNTGDVHSSAAMGGRPRVFSRWSSAGCACWPQV